VKKPNEKKEIIEAIKESTFLRLQYENKVEIITHDYTRIEYLIGIERFVKNIKVDPIVQTNNALI
jgi:hypothetical protein